jgi:imidazolonepropionase-like amidohydrolase
MRLEKTGRVQAGAVADLLVVDGDPLENIDAVADSTHHRLIIKRGEQVQTRRGDAAPAVAALAAAQ